MNRTPLKFIRSRAGIALMSVLTVSVILLALAGAFFAAHKTDLVLMGSSIKLEKTKNSALSAAEFVQYKIENDRHFGLNAFREDVILTETFPAGASEPLLEVEYVGDENHVYNNIIKGKMLKTDLEFEAQVLNNLNSNSVGLHPRGEAPPRSARVWITAKRGQVTKRMDFILKHSPLSSVSILSGGDVSVQLTNSEDGHWWLGARQPSGNGVRANGTITGPEILSRAGRAVLFEPPEGLGSKIKPPYGVIQGKNLRMQMDGVMTNVNAGHEDLEQAEENIKGVLSPESSEVEIPKLNSDDLASPTRIYHMPADKVTFRTREISGRTTHQLLMDGQVQASYDGVGNNRRVFAWPPGSQSYSPDTVALFDLESRVMTVSQDVELRTDGEFVLEGAASESGSEASQPTLVLGSEKVPSSIKAKNGISIEGSVGGMGALKAGGGDLKIRAKSSLSTTPDFGIALHSDRDVVLSKPGQSNQDGIPTDWDAFSTAYKKEPVTEISEWSDQNEWGKRKLASHFSGIKLAEAGEYTTSNDPIWLSLTKDYPADEKAKAAYDEWMQEEVEEITEEVLVTTGGGETGTSGGDTTTSTGTSGGDTTTSTGTSGGDTTTSTGTSGGDTTTSTGTSGGDTTTSTGTSGGGTTGSGGEPPEPVYETVVVQEGIPAGPGVNVEKYVRLREYLKTLKAGDADDTWLGSDEPDIYKARRDDVKSLIQNQLSSFQLAAGQTAEEKNGHVILKWNKLGDYFKQSSNPFLTGFTPDMKFRGLVYAGGNFSFDTKKQGIELEGALVAHNDISISNATGARFIYNSELLENMFATNEGDMSAKLERVFWAYY
jgi:hypothetical protein